MDDYKELICELHSLLVTDCEEIQNTAHKAADAIEHLVAECNRLQSVYDEIDKAHIGTIWR